MFYATKLCREDEADFEISQFQVVDFQLGWERGVAINEIDQSIWVYLCCWGRRIKYTLKRKEREKKGGIEVSCRHRSE